jgi:hypothetical protein
MSAYGVFLGPLTGIMMVSKFYRTSTSLNVDLNRLTNIYNEIESSGHPIFICPVSLVTIGELWLLSIYELDTGMRAQVPAWFQLESSHNLDSCESNNN